MADFLDYIRWRGDLTLKERSLNEVDNLILSELVYFRFEDVLTERRSVTIRQAWERWQELTEPRGYFTNDPLPLLKECAQSRRFGDVLVTDYVSKVDQERQMQFAAAVFWLEQDVGYVAFRGTDSTLVGWREDFHFSYMEETPAQSEAVRYLERALDSVTGKVYVGGHSKGGNLAIYAAAFCDHPERGRVAAVYSNDGPGFNQYITAEPRYQEVLPKVQLIIPEGSIISILLSNKSEKRIVRSSAHAEDGVKQHSPYTWKVERDRFLAADRQNSASIMLNETLNHWLDSLNDEEKKRFVSTIFDVLDASGAVTLEELNANKWISYNAILKAASAQSDDVKNHFRDTLIKLARSGREALWNETRKRFEPLRHKGEKPAQLPR